MDSTVSPKGQVTVRLFDKDGNLKSESVQYNIITSQGDQYIADLLSLTPARQKINATNCFVVVGTGYTGTNNKNQTWVNTQTGSPQAVTAGYPQLAGTWGNTGANILNFSFTYTVGSLSVTGVNEAALVSANIQGSSTTCLAYVQIASTNVAISDSLQIVWSITFLGS
jgi:hypothetical protein